MKERVKQLCKEKGVSMNAAESEMGLAKGYISKLGNSNPNQKTLQKMSEYFGVSVEYLINGKEEDSEQKITSLSQSEELDIMKDVDVIIDKLKTDAGKQRIVPIHSRIQELVKSNYEFAVSIGSEYLFNDKGQTHSGSWEVTYDKYANRFKKVISQLNLNPEHRPHDPRKTFITIGKKANMDEYALKEMVGHSVQDITESTYTVRDLEWLREDIEKIK